MNEWTACDSYWDQDDSQMCISPKVYMAVPLPLLNTHIMSLESSLTVSVMSLESSLTVSVMGLRTHVKSMFIKFLHIMFPDADTCPQYGKLYACGKNQQGQLGVNSIQDQYQLTPVQNLG
jgi:hypothetical protein